MARVRERVLAAARKAAVKRAAGDVSVAEVARVAGVSWPTANRHLGGKSGLDALLGAPPLAVDPSNTHDRLLAAAARCVAKGGVDGASLDAVSVEAGVTKGALYWHFDTKATLIQALAAAAGGPPEGAPTWAAQVDAQLARDGVAAALDVELAAGARDPSVRATMSERRALERAQLVARFGLASEAQAAVLRALLDGLSIARRLDPQLDTDALRDAIHALVRVTPRG